MANGIISVGMLLNGFVRLSLLLLCVCALILGVDLAHRLVVATQSVPNDLREFGMTKTVAVDVRTDDDGGSSSASWMLLEALLARLMLVPILLRLTGRAAGRLPRWLDRLLPDVRFGH
jgi:hypothetical protein